MSVIRIEAFQRKLHGSRILCQGKFKRDELPPVLEAVQDIRAPFKRRVLFRPHSSTSSPLQLMSQTFPQNYDAVFTISEGVDWSIAVTYLLHMPKPILLVIDGIAAIPETFWTKIPTKSITIIHTIPTIYLTLSVITPYDTIFYSKIKEPSEPFMEHVHRQLTLLRGDLGAREFRETVQELAVARAGLCWSTGTLYWYDPTAERSDRLTAKQLSELLRWAADEITTATTVED